MGQMDGEGVREGGYGTDGWRGSERGRLWDRWMEREVMGQMDGEGVRECTKCLYMHAYMILKVTKTNSKYSKTSQSYITEINTDEDTSS